MELTPNIETQLISYLTQLHISVGIIICNKIYVFVYDYIDSKSKKISIEFTQNNQDGVKFIELFSKGNFNKKSVDEFIEQKEEFSKRVKEIEEVIDVDFVLSSIENNLSSKYSKSEIDEGLRSFNISVSKKTTAPTHTFTKQPQTVDGNTKKTVKYGNSGISKIESIEIFKNKGVDIRGNVTFSTSKTTSSKFWANPNINVIKDDWFIIFNDAVSRKLFLAFVPANTINMSQLRTRSDKQTLVDLQVYYENGTFTDRRSNYSFGEYIISEAQY